MENYGAPRKRPSIDYVEAELLTIVNLASNALIDSGAPIYARGTSLVRPQILPVPGQSNGVQRSEGSVVLAPVCKTWLMEALTDRVRWWKHYGMADKKKPVACPPIVAETIIARRGDWPFPPLLAVTSVPTMRADGSIVSRPGYDAATGILFMSEATWPPIAERPTREEAFRCLARLKDLIATFPFVDGADVSAALALILTALVRPSLPSAPLFGVNAPTPGTGKSKLIDIAALLATGRKAAVMSASREEAELQKQIGSALMAGDAFLALDNVDHPLKSEFLCQVLTQQTVKVRVLGESRNMDVPTNATLCATGNSLRISEDLTRRIVLVNLDARCERPEERVFPGRDPVEIARSERVALVTAGLTFLRAYISSGAPSVPPLGSFEAWSDLIRSALIWIGETDPLQNAEKVRDSDPERERTTAILHALPAGKWTVSVVADQLSHQGDDSKLLAEALEGFFDRGAFSRQRFGSFLRKHQGRILNGLKIANRGLDRNKTVIWEIDGKLPNEAAQW